MPDKKKLSSKEEKLFKNYQKKIKNAHQNKKRGESGPKSIKFK